MIYSFHEKNKEVLSQCIHNASVEGYKGVKDGRISFE